MPKQKEEHVALTWKPLDKLLDIDLPTHSLRKLLPLWIAGNKQEKFMSEMI